eukprot:CAMPEP_0172500280 /NCGR_PEP_ID=MMETSP1066-20121228/136390_1 /TAXON_ID=671091 /ORGANISM="Coscinodiscus wailesii, Strain CCMP2513" /LENGTH=149 /DNA_ID=CAMNT_0013274423 /DNA_START=247 /DNA_END=696 /DNA_ORIENTATION=+
MERNNCRHCFWDVCRDVVNDSAASMTWMRSLETFLPLFLPRGGGVFLSVLVSFRGIGLLRDALPGDSSGVCVFAVTMSSSRRVIDCNNEGGTPSLNDFETARASVFIAGAIVNDECDITRLSSVSDDNTKLSPAAPLTHLSPNSPSARS